MSSSTRAAETVFRFVTCVFFLLASVVLLPVSALADDFITPGARDPDKSTVSKDGTKEVDRDKDGNVIEEREFDVKASPKKLTKKTTFHKYHKNKHAAEMRVWHASITDDNDKVWNDVTETYTYGPKGESLTKAVRHRKSVKYYKWTQFPGTGSGKWERDQEREEKEKEKKPEKKKKEDTSRPSESHSYFHGGELEINMFAIWAIGEAQETETHTRTEKATRTVTRDRTVQREVLIDDPTIGDFRLVTRDVEEPVREKETFRRKVRESEQVGPFDDQAFGLGVDAKYFVNRNVGAGVEMNWLSGDHDAFTFSATVTARFPFESTHLAPYLVGGLGVQCADTNRLIGFFGAGLMKRFSPSCGAFIEGRYRFDGDEENVCEIRTGISISFGHTAETPGQVILVERHRSGASSDVWEGIDPITKSLHR